MTFECEGRAIQLRNLDTILSCTRGNKKSAASVGGLQLLLPVFLPLDRPAYRDQFGLHPVTCVIDRYIYMYMFVKRLLFWVGRVFC